MFNAQGMLGTGIGIELSFWNLTHPSNDIVTLGDIQILL